MVAEMEVAGGVQIAGSLVCCVALCVRRGIWGSSPAGLLLFLAAIGADGSKGVVGVEVQIEASGVVRWCDPVRAEAAAALPSVGHQGDGQGGRRWLVLRGGAGEQARSKTASWEIIWSSSSTALHRRHAAVQPLTLMAERRPLRTLALAVCRCYLTFFLPAGAPKGWIFCSFVAAIKACTVPSGAVPGDGAGRRGVKLIFNSGEGPDGVLLFLFRVIL